jgi:hypothetical protein
LKSAVELNWAEIFLGVDENAVGGYYIQRAGLNYNAMMGDSFVAKNERGLT